MKATLPPPDLKLRRFYEGTCDCGLYVDGKVRSTVLRSLAVHRQTCNATLRLERQVTVIWKGKDWNVR